tara:strand:+ start:1844 stop:3094 length:1251 start_codon:yes stop_codon:yes gene_type:complete
MELRESISQADCANATVERLVGSLRNKLTPSGSVETCCASALKEASDEHKRQWAAWENEQTWGEKPQRKKQKSKRTESQEKEPEDSFKRSNGWTVFCAEHKKSVQAMCEEKGCEFPSNFRQELQALWDSSNKAVKDAYKHQAQSGNLEHNDKVRARKRDSLIQSQQSLESVEEEPAATQSVTISPRGPSSFSLPCGAHGLEDKEFFMNPSKLVQAWDELKNEPGAEVVNGEQLDAWFLEESQGKSRILQQSESLPKTGRVYAWDSFFISDAAGVVLQQLAVRFQGKQFPRLVVQDRIVFFVVCKVGKYAGGYRMPITSSKKSVSELLDPYSETFTCARRDFHLIAPQHLAEVLQPDGEIYAGHVESSNFDPETFEFKMCFKLVAKDKEIVVAEPKNAAKRRKVDKDGQQVNIWGQQ